MFDTHFMLDLLLAILLSPRFVFFRTIGGVLRSWVDTDVIKSRVQLRATPPTGTPVQYIAHEFKAIVSESGL